MASVRACEVLVALRAPGFDLPLTYDAGELDLRIGDVVAVDLGPRRQIGYVIQAPYLVEPDRELRPVTALPQTPRAFDETGLALARFIAARYLCTLAEAVSAVTLGFAAPRITDRLEPATERPQPERYPSVPPRLLDLIWNELREGVSLEHLLRHPDARRTAERRVLLRHIGTLVRSGDLRRTRTTERARVRPYQLAVLHPGTGTIRGPKASALVAFVRADPGVPRSDALLAGFSNAILARAIRTGAIIERHVEPARERERRSPLAPEFVPTPPQADAIERIDAARRAGAPATLLLQGITGSGKTLVYIESIARVVREGGRAIVLVPEISLTPQTARRFERAFGSRVAVVHSALSERERYDAWHACARGEIDVVVGARSAVFAPLADVRIIVIDEAHERTYKQETSPRYDAVAVARERMRLVNGVLLLGSATPSLESYAAARSGAISHLRLEARATAQPLPQVRIVDMTREFSAGNRRVFSAPLLDALDERLRRGEKSVLFVNRRGSAGFVLCRACGAVPECRRCSVSLAVHRTEALLRCHYCDRQVPLPARCAQCGSETLREFGIGTERVAEDVAQALPTARVVRMDSDTTTRVGDHARLLDAFGTDGDVLVGTQMVAKGLDFPTVTLVGVVAADIGLHAPDFRASERTFGLITQVCGRSGRSRPGEAIVQTYSPEHPAIVAAATHDYDGFATRELAERAESGFPPSRALVYLGVIARERLVALERARLYAARIRGIEGISVLGPAPYPIARLNDAWRFRVALLGTKRAVLRDAVRERVLPMATTDRTSRLVVHVDP